MEKKRYANIDLLKTVAILMVIALHSQLFKLDFIQYNNISSYIQYFLRIICEGVAIFILVNGFLLINKKEFDLKRHLLKILKIFILLILWSIILTTVIKLIYQEPLKISEIIKNIFVIDINNKYTGVLWFLQSLIALYLIYPVLKILHDKDKNVYDYLFIVVLIFTMGTNLLSIISELINTKIKCNAINLVISYMSNFQVLYNRNFLIFFMFGGYLFENKEKFEERKTRRKWIVIGLVSWIIAFAFAVIISKSQNKTYMQNFNYGSIFMPFILIGIFAATYNYKSKEKWYNKIIETISKNSLGIYLIHIIIVRIISSLYTGQLSLPLRICKVIIVFIVSLMITLLIKKIPKVKKLVEL